MAKAEAGEAYKFVAYLPGGFAMFQHPRFFDGKPFILTREQCKGRLQKLIEQDIPNDQTLAALNTWPAEEEKKLTVH